MNLLFSADTLFTVSEIIKTTTKRYLLLSMGVSCQLMVQRCLLRIMYVLLLPFISIEYTS